MTIPKREDIDLIENREVIGRYDVGTQVEKKFEKHNFVGLSGYSEWNKDELEPFIKVNL